MQIEDIERQVSLEFLSRMRLGRLACVRESQPYITPLYYVYHDSCIYSFSTVGKKIEWMRSNARVCVEVDDIKSPQQWISVVVFGRYEELPNAPEWQQTREMVHSLLEPHGVWWEPGFARTVLGGVTRPMVPVFFRIFIEQITGHRASLEIDRSSTETSPAKTAGRWWRRLGRGP
jgi:uncharacterized protein